MTSTIDSSKKFYSSPAEITAAARALRSGELVVFPTETVYGIGANAYNEGAVRKIFAVKRRPATNPLILHIAGSHCLHTVLHVESELIQRRLERLSPLWPGPLTIVTTKAPTIPDCVSAGLPTVGVRVPDHPVALALLEEAGVPIAAPSANRSTAISPTLLEHVKKAFGDEIRWYLEGGPCAVGLESTIVLISSHIPRILRPGVITLEEIQDLLAEHVTPHLAPEDSNRPLAPGQSALHYAPKTPMVFLDETDLTNLPERIGLITFTPIDLTRFQGKYVVNRALGDPAAASLEFAPDINRAEGTETRTEVTKPDLRRAAQALYATLHELDALALDLILVARPDYTGKGAHAVESNSLRSSELVMNCGLDRALLDRITRATKK